MNYKKVLYVVSFGVLFFSQSLYGYIDPGTGSFIFQLLIAGLAGGLYAIKVFWKQIAKFFSSIFTRNK